MNFRQKLKHAFDLAEIGNMIHPGPAGAVLLLRPLFDDEPQKPKLPPRPARTNG